MKNKQKVLKQLKYNNEDIFLCLDEIEKNEKINKKYNIPKIYKIDYLGI
jgi:hypothetical protein